MSTDSSQQIIFDVLPKDGSPVRFKALAAACKEKGLSRDALSRHLDRLEKAGAIIKEAVTIKTGAGTQYRLTLPIPSPEPAGFKEDWERFIEKAIKEVQEARDALSAFDAQLAQLVDISTMTPEFWQPYAKANDDIGNMVGSATAALGGVIINILSNYSEIEDANTAALYLKTAADSYIPNLIRDIARLTPPGSKFKEPALIVALARLLAPPFRESRRKADGSCQSDAKKI